MRLMAVVALAPFALSMSGCGFQPLYASANKEKVVSLANVQLMDVTGRDAVVQAITDAFDARAIGSDEGPTYNLWISAQESAQALAVQIDATVSRFSYQIVGQYRLADVSTGKRVSGSVTSVASFNVVTSNYSTLVAEQAARDKAARQLTNLIERDALLKLSRANANIVNPAKPDPIIEDDDLVDAYLPTDPRDPGAEEFEDPEGADVWGDFTSPAPLEIGDEPAPGVDATDRPDTE
ncbi:MAG: hypothetical protein AAFX08_05075 [Pseudomonadota bacterium]